MPRCKNCQCTTYACAQPLDPFNSPSSWPSRTVGEQQVGLGGTEPSVRGYSGRVHTRICLSACMHSHATDLTLCIPFTHPKSQTVSMLHPSKPPDTCVVAVSQQPRQC
jgi:hypothetical protein